MLVALPQRWDEACFAVPALRTLVRSGMVGGLLCLREQEEFWKMETRLPQIHYVQRSKVSALAAAVGGGWQAALVWEDGVVAKALAKAGIAKRIGDSSGAFSKFLTDPLEITESAVEHRVRRYMKTCELMGIPVDRAEYFAPASMGVSAPPRSVLLCPGSDFGPSYEWPLDRWQELAEELLSQGKSLTVAGAISERGLGKILSQRLGADAEYLHAHPLSSALPMLAAHQLVIAADGSIPHLAAHSGATCVTLFGPNDVVWKRPLGKRHSVVKRHAECVPCLSPKCLLDGRCQRELDVATVLAAIPKTF